MTLSFQWLKTFTTLQTTLPTLFLASIILVLLPKILQKITSTKRKYNLPPSPPKLPIIGNLHQVGNMPHLSFRRLASKYGPIIYLQLGEIPTVVVSSAKLAKVMKTNDLAIASRPQIFSAKHLFYNCTDVAFAPYGAYWRHVRKICILELLSVKKVQSFSFVRQEEAIRLVRRIQQSCHCTTNLSKILGLYTNDVLCRVAFSRDFSEGGDYDRHGFQQMLVDYQELLGGLSVGDYFPSMEFIHSLTGMKSRLIKTFHRFDKFFDEVIEDRLNHKRGKDEHKDLLDVLLDIQMNRNDGDMALTMDNVKAIMLVMFAAGTDTTFITLDWGMTELLMNPKIMKKAQHEIRNIVGERELIVESDLHHMHYLKSTIKEIYRLHPPAPLLVPRESMEDVTIAGFDIPAKTRFFVNAWAIGRDPESWKDPETFDPERFIDSPIDFKGQDFELIPFGAGRRMCPAIAFGEATVELAFAQILHSFDWELPPGIEAKDLDVNELFGVTMHRTADLIVVATPRFA